MEQRKKIRILSWALIFILIINFSAIGTMIYRHSQFVKEFRPKEEFIPGNPKMPGRHGKNDIYKQFLVKELNLSVKQQNQFDIIKKDFISESHLYFDSIHYYNDLIDSQLNYNSPNKLLINNYASKIGDFHKNLKIEFIDYNIQLKNILTKAQKRRYFDAFTKFRRQCSYFEQKEHRNKKPFNK